MTPDPRLFPHVNGRPNLSVGGGFALAYKHPHDLHMTPIFNHVSQQFIWEYLTTRDWVRRAQESGWRFVCLPASDLQPGGRVQ